MDGIKKLLDAGKISGIEQKSVLLAKILLLLKKCLAQVGDVVCLHIFTDARRNGCGGLGVVKQRNIRAFAGKGAGRKTAELRFQQTQQRVDPLRLRLQIRPDTPSTCVQHLHRRKRKAAAAARGSFRLPSCGCAGIIQPGCVPFRWVNTESSGRSRRKKLLSPSTSRRSAAAER